jgi:hypothetical protein
VLLNQTLSLNDDGDYDLSPLINTRAARNDLSRRRTLMRNDIPIEIAETWASSGDFDEQASRDGMLAGLICLVYQYISLAIIFRQPFKARAYMHTPGIDRREYQEGWRKL